MRDAAILEVRDIRVHFKVKSKGQLPWARPKQLKAVDGVSFDLYAGETLCVVGESGCGKSTLARAILSLVPRSAGSVAWMGKPLDASATKDLHAARSDMQIIFQDPLASLDPRMTIGQIIAEPLQVHRPGMSKADRLTAVRAMMAKVGLRDDMLNRYAHEFSGGQCQRIGIARALIIAPKLVVCDEPVSALDVSIQAQIVNLLKTLQKEMGLALIFISHDLAVVKHIADRVVVMYLGRVMEMADKDVLFGAPKHPYTQALISAIPIPDPLAARSQVVNILSDDIPSPINPPSGCVFHTRCPKREARCAVETPILQDVTSQKIAHRVACLLV